MFFLGLVFGGVVGGTLGHEFRCEHSIIDRESMTCRMCASCSIGALVVLIL